MHAAWPGRRRVSTLRRAGARSAPMPVSPQHANTRIKKCFCRRRCGPQSGATMGASARLARGRACRRTRADRTPELVAAAKREGKVVFYTPIDLAVAQKIGKAFEAAYPG